MQNLNRKISRRAFLEQGAGRAGMLALGGAALGRASAASDQSFNPFGYEVEHFARTDPKLIGYEQMARFPAGQPEPRRIEVAPDGKLYIAGKNGLTVLGPEGSAVSEISIAAGARCVALASDGTTYAGARDHLEVFDSKGRPLKAWDSPGGKVWFSGLTVGPNELYAADSGNRVILRYDRSGKLLGRIGAKNKERNVPGLIVPSPYLDVDLAKDGLLRVNNPGRHCVETYTPDGDLELSWGKPTAAIEGFCGCCNPIGLALLPDGRCVTCEKGLPRVKIYSPEGKFECVVAGAESFPENAKACSPRNCTMGGLDAATDAEGRIYILDLIAGDIRVMRKKA